jgi:hypothetical protein
VDPAIKAVYDEIAAAMGEKMLAIAKRLHEVENDVTWDEWVKLLDVMFQCFHMDPEVLKEFQAVRRAYSFDADKERESVDRGDEPRDVVLANLVERSRKVKALLSQGGRI